MDFQFPIRYHSILQCIFVATFVGYISVGRRNVRGIIFPHHTILTEFRNKFRRTGVDSVRQYN